MERQNIEEYLARESEITYRIRGRSMLPLLRQDKDTVTIHIVSKEDLIKKYDVVLYKRGDQLVLHRVVGENKDGYVILGDNTYRVERGIVKDSILGRMTGFSRAGKAHSVKELPYRIYARIWVWSYPLRHAYVRGKVLAVSVLKGLVRKSNRD